MKNRMQAHGPKTGCGNGTPWTGARRGALRFVSGSMEKPEAVKDAILRDVEAVRQNALDLQFMPGRLSAGAPRLCLEPVPGNPQVAEFVPWECRAGGEAAAAGFADVLRAAGEQGGSP